MKRLSKLRLILACTGAAIALSCGASEYYPPPESEGGWRRNSEPEFLRSLGLDPEKLEAFGQYNLSVPNSNWKPYADYKGILVIKNGWIVGEWYNTPEARTFRTYLSSNGKAFAMICFGILVQDAATGRVDLPIRPESPVYDPRWLPEGFPLSDPLKKAITFEQIFQHTSGLCPERTGTGEPLEQGRNQWTDYAKWVVGHDVQWPQTGRLYFSPGQARQWPEKEVWGEHAGGYSSVGFGHIGLVLRNVYDTPARKFLWDRLLKPLGFSGIDFHAPPSEEIQWFSAGGLRLTPRDYARFAYFLLRDGRWDGEQIVPPSWVQRFRTSTRYPNIRSNFDGYFGKYPKDMFRIAGSGVNWAFIIPSLDLIAIRTGRADNRRWDTVEQQFLEKLFAAVVSDGPGGREREASAARAPGQIVADPENPRWLRRYDRGPFFMAGPGDPEGFLYRGELNPDGTRDGDQMDLIGKLKGTGANCIYLMAIRSHGGDGDETQNPFLDHDPARGINSRILDQWERWFTVMDRQGIVIFFFFYDDGARLVPRQNPVGEEERLLIRTLVERFKHHKNLIWCVAEEYQEAFTPEAALDFAAEIRAADDFQHPIAVHKLTGTDFSELTGRPSIDQFAMQLGVAGAQPVVPTPEAAHALVVEAWRKASGRYNLNMSEMAGHYVAGDRTLTRLKSWAAAMGGAYVMVIGMDIQNAEVEVLKDCGRLVRFLESTDFQEMQPHDELRYGGTEYVLASPTKSYILYSSGRSSLQTRHLGLKNLTSGTYTLRWFDCATGREVSESVEALSENQIWAAPPDFGRDVALYLKRNELTSEDRHR